MIFTHLVLFKFFAGAGGTPVEVSEAPCPYRPGRVEAAMTRAGRRDETQSRFGAPAAVADSRFGRRDETPSRAGRTADTDPTRPGRRDECR